MGSRHRLGARALTACVSAFGLLIAYGPAAGAASAPIVPQVRATQHPQIHHSARQVAAARAELKHLLASWHGTAELVGGHGALGSAGSIKAPDTPTAILSSNWSGYGDLGTDFDGVGATWIEPTVTCGPAPTLVGFWVGIDGLDTDSVEQDGTLVECDNGSPSYYMWWEMFPANDVQVVSTVNPGDSITASVTRAGSSYFLDLTDNTTGQGFGVSSTCEADTATSTCLDASAEWIAEAPSSDSGVVQPLSDFQSWGLTSATVESSAAAAGTISSFPDYSLTMIDADGVIEAEPSALNSDGNAFGVVFRPTQLPLVPREQQVGKHPSGAPYPSRTPAR
jgi:Peptidase A4 family